MGYYFLLILLIKNTYENVLKQTHSFSSGGNKNW